MKQRFTYFLLGTLSLLLGIVGFSYSWTDQPHPMDGLYQWPLVLVLCGWVLAVLSKYKWPVAWVLLGMGLISWNWVDAPVPYGSIWIPLCFVMLGIWHVLIAYRWSRAISQVGVRLNSE
jgi:hypothetical protein